MIVAAAAIESQAGSPRKLRNPWGEAPIDLCRNGATARGERIVAVPSGSPPDRYKRSLP